MLSNGQGKIRARRDGSARPPAEWRVLFLSTGEISLAQKIAEGGTRRTTGGQEVRVVDIPADADTGMGLFENIHGSENPEAFSRELREKAGLFYGTPIRPFLEILANRFDEPKVIFDAFRSKFKNQFCPPGASGQVERVAARFSLVAAAGELATNLHILPWPEGEATKAAAACFQDWLDQRGGAEPTEITDGIAQVRAFFERHGSSRFELWGEKDVPFQ